MIRQRKRAWRHIQRRRFRCSVCGTEVVAPKAAGRTSEGHIKHMWCFVCKERTEHVQLGIRNMDGELIDLNVEED